MLLKTIKHDFAFGAKSFFSMGAIALGVGVLVSFLLNQADQQGQFVPGNTILNMILMIMGLSVAALGISSVVQIFQLFNKNFFSNAGYLMLTLPVKRGTLMASKLIVSMAWFIYGLVIAFAVAAIIVIPADAITLEEFLGTFDPNFFVDILTLTVAAFTTISVMFLCTTLSRSVFFGKRIHGLASGIFAFGILWFFAWAMQELTLRHRGIQSPAGADWWQGGMPLIGWEYGRVLVYQPDFGWPVFIDIYQMALGAAIAAAAIAATQYLLKRRISLR